MISTRILSFICFAAIVVSFFIQKNRSAPKASGEIHFASIGTDSSERAESLNSSTDQVSKKSFEQSTGAESVAAGSKSSSQQLTDDEKHWQSQRSFTRQYFSTLPVGVALAEVTALIEVEARNPSYSYLFEQSLSKVISHPDDAIREIYHSLDKIPNQQQDHRRYLIQLATKLNVPEKDKIALLQKDLEFQRSYELENKNSRFGTSITFDALMDTTNDTDIIVSEARLLAQQYKKSQGSRTALLRFAARYPAEAQKIKREIGE